MVISDKILTSAMHLFLKYGVKSVSMDDIAKKLGISKKTIYAAVENKKDLIYKVVVDFTKKEESIILEMIESKENALDQMLEIGKHVTRFFREMKPSLVYDLQKYHPKVWEYIENDHFLFIEETIKKNIALGQAHGYYRNDLHSDIISKLYMAQTKTLVDEDIFPNRDFAKAQLFGEFLSYHLLGLCTEKGRKYLTKNLDIN